MKVSAQLYTLREHLKTPDEIAASLKKVKQIGYNSIQASAIGPIGDEAFKQLADAERLDICATHVKYPDLTEDLDAVISKHHTWNCRYVGLGSLPDHYRNQDGYARFAEEISGIARQLKAEGLQFVYHNHHFEFVRYGDRTGMDILLEETDPDAVDFELDVFWLQAGGADPIEWIHKVAGRMKVVHLKDMSLGPDLQPRFAEVGEGNMNIKGIVEACKETGVEWAPVEQDQCYDRDPFDSLAISLKNLQALGLES